MSKEIELVAMGLVTGIILSLAAFFFYDIGRMNGDSAVRDEAVFMGLAKRGDQGFQWKEATK